MMMAIKFILNSFLLLSLFGLASSNNFNPVSGDKGFKTTTELRCIYDNQDAKSRSVGGGYHKAEMYFKTKVPSINLDQGGISDIDCKDGKISFTAKDKDAIKLVNDWPDKVMLVVSHKWKCFGKSTTQFYMVSDKVVDVTGKKATFTAEGCDVKDWSEKYALDISWVDNATTNKRRRKYKRFDPIEFSKKLNLNVLFDEKTGKSSKPNIPIVQSSQSNTGESLVCANCFANGEAVITLRVAGGLIPPKIDDAFIALNGTFKINLDIALKGKVGTALAPPEIQLFNLPLSPLGVPNLFSLGPSLELVASAKLSAELSGTFRAGAEISLPNFVANASFVGEPKFQQSGFKPIVNASTDPEVDLTASANINGSLKPRIAFGIDVLNDLVSVKAGFQVVASLDSSISISNKGDCKKQPRLKSVLGGNLGFFLQKDDFPIVTFPSTNLLNECIKI